MKHAFGTCVKSTVICNAMPDGWTCIAWMYGFMSVNTVCRDLAITITTHCHYYTLNLWSDLWKLTMWALIILSCIVATIFISKCIISLIFVNCRYISPFVTWLWKTDQVVTFGISRNTNFKYSSHCSSLVLDSSHARYTV